MIDVNRAEVTIKIGGRIHPHPHGLSRMVGMPRVASVGRSGDGEGEARKRPGQAVNATIVGVVDRMNAGIGISGRAMLLMRSSGSFSSDVVQYQHYYGRELKCLRRSRVTGPRIMRRRQAVYGDKTRGPVSKPQAEGPNDGSPHRSYAGSTG